MKTKNWHIYILHETPRTTSRINTKSSCHKYLKKSILHIMPNLSHVSILEMFQEKKSENPYILGIIWELNNRTPSRIWGLASLLTTAANQTTLFYPSPTSPDKFRPQKWKILKYFKILKFSIISKMYCYTVNTAHNILAGAEIK